MKAREVHSGSVEDTRRQGRHDQFQLRSDLITVGPLEVAGVTY